MGKSKGSKTLQKIFFWVEKKTLNFTFLDRDNQCVNNISFSLVNFYLSAGFVN